MNESNINKGDKTLSIVKKFSPIEKVIFYIFVLLLIFSSLILINRVNDYFLVDIKASGGIIKEGVIGLPRYINPVLAFTDIDSDLTNIIYSGLMKYSNGKLINDLAESYSVSKDGLVYDFIIKDNIRFHDGTILTTDDIEFTIQKIQDANLKSPHAADWANINIKKISSREIQFILKQPYTPFITNTTIGILPKHIWKNIESSQFIFSKYNLEPIGSGPFKLNSINRDNSGLPVYYNLISFNRYYNNPSYLNSIFFYFFSNEKLLIEAYNSSEIESMAGISPVETAEIASSTSAIILKSALPRIFGIFFNQNNSPVLANKEIRQALEMSIDKNKIINDVLFGYGVSINSPLPIGIIKSTSTKEIYNSNIDKDKARDLLNKNGWTINADGILEKKDKKSTQVFEFSIATADNNEFKKIAEILKKEWESIGANVNIKVFEYGDLSQNIIKTRKYDSLLFGELIGKDLDLYAFWHSSQRNSPGLNVSLYTNSKVDKILEDSRTTLDESERNILYESFQKTIKEEIPAIFLYSPEYTYIVPQKLKGINLNSITNSSDRFNDIESWYIETNKVWKFFTKDKYKEIK